ncbi:hypothetical protein MNV49_004972 [Pseudohyphozyma bogoriensis]|nr:hypothetical protein MNV49_004972 [Pseudohyphozyma bogoriensis]
MLPFLVAAAALLASQSVAITTHCPSTYVPDLPLDQTALSVPTGDAVAYVAIARGTQNYTCDGSTWQSTGAVASLYDISCLDSSAYPSLATSALAVNIAALRHRSRRHASHHVFDTLPRKAKRSASPSPAPHVYSSVGTVLSDIGSGTHGASYLGSLTYVDVEGVLTLKFDFTETVGGEAYALVERVAGLNSPDDASADIKWVEFSVEEGALAKTVFQVDTQSGQAPSSCSDSGSILTVAYSAVYVFYA